MGTPIQEPAFDPVLFDMRHVLDLGLQTRREATGRSGPPKGWWASSLGYCFRRQYLQRLDVPALRDDTSGSRTLWLGDIVHQHLQWLLRDSGLLLAEELPVRDAELSVGARVDAVWGGPVQAVEEGLDDRIGLVLADWVTFYRERINELYDSTPFPITVSEFKTAHQFSAEKMYTQGASFHHKMQAGIVRGLIERNPDQLPDTIAGDIERYDIVVVAKNDLKIVTFPIYPHDRDAAIERVVKLNEYWDQEILPPCTCGEEVSWEKRYCRYRDPNSTERSPRCCDASLESLAPEEEAR